MKALTAEHAPRLPDQITYLDGRDERSVTGGIRVIWGCALMIACFLAWAAWFEVVEVSTGTGKVVPSSREQVIQSMEGGIIKEMNVTEGSLVERGQVLAQLDAVKTESNVGESEAKYRAALASVNRLQAEVSEKPLVFDPSLNNYPELIARRNRAVQHPAQGPAIHAGRHPEFAETGAQRIGDHRKSGKDRRVEPG
jgi:adhesin transport system membrane fusion protein